MILSIFHVLTGHMYVFFCEVYVQIFCTCNIESTVLLLPFEWSFIGLKQHKHYLIVR